MRPLIGRRSSGINLLFMPRAVCRCTSRARSTARPAKPFLHNLGIRIMWNFETYLPFAFVLQGL